MTFIRGAGNILNADLLDVDKDGKLSLVEYENKLFQGTSAQSWNDTVFISCDLPDAPPPSPPVTAEPPPPSEQFNSISESFLERFETLEWGVGSSGVCGAYSPSRQSCLQPNDRARWERAVKQSCLGAPQVPRNFSGCYFRMTAAGHVHVIPADLSGDMLEARAEVIFSLLPARTCDLRALLVQTYKC